ncbi:MAG: OmpA family protein [Phycisphaerales bacterium]|nr:OmpA family protein [Phycisphaerales bacterium]MCI0674279.1 OmpA family protein [Phycisphaerales bacterium]
MTKSRMMIIGLLVAAFGLTGCNSKAKNKAMTGDVASLQAALAQCEEEKRARDQQLAELRHNMNSGMAETGFENIPGVTGSASAGEVTASVESDLLFDSGKTTLKPNAKKSLDAVAGVLNSTYASQTIRIAGHTDSDPIKKSGHKSNYHLGFERAFAVREYLISKGVDSKRISLASFGPDVPKGSKPQNRRVEVVVVLNGTSATAMAN